MLSYDPEFLVQDSIKRMLLYIDTRARAKGRDTDTDPPSTKRIFLLYIKLFCEKIAERTPDKLIELRNQDLKSDNLKIRLHHEEMANQFIIYLSKLGKSSNTIASALSAVRTFYSTNYVDLSEKAVIVPSGQPEKPLWRPDLSDIAKLVQKAKKIDDKRSAAYICCGKDCGIGISDMLKIKWSTKSLEFGTLKEQFKQGNCPIHIPFLGQGRQKTMVKFETFWGEDAITTLNNYADFNEERIFKISDNQIRMDLAALDPRLKPHTLRKVFTQTMKRSLSTLLTNRGQADASGLSDAIVEYWCTPPETLLLKNNYVDSIGTSKINDGVLTDLGEYSSITKTYARHYDGEMIYISPYFASTLALTPNHEIRSIKTVKCSFRHNKVCSPNCYEKTKIKYCKKPWTSYKPDWIPAEKLTLNDLVLLRIPIEVNNVKTLRISDLVKGTFVKNNCIFMAENRYGRIANNPNAQNLQNNIHLTPDFMRLVGYYLAEGSIGSKNRTLSFSFNTKEEKYAKDVNSILSEMGLTTKTLDRSKEGKDELRVSVNCKPLSLLFKKLFGNKAEKKHIPHLFMSLPDNKVLELLKGLFRGDGSLGRKNRLEFKTTSRNMAYQIWLLLIRLNYIGTVKESSPRESRIQGRAVIGKKAYRVYLTDPKLAFLIFGTSEKTDRRVRKLAYTANNYLCMRLRRIERRHYTGIVCNLRMQNHPSYTTISATVHNCGHSLGKVRAAYNIPSIKTQIEMYREAYPRIKLKVR